MYKSRERYIADAKANHLYWAKLFHKLGKEDTMWSQIWMYTIAEDYYRDVLLRDFWDEKK